MVLLFTYYWLKVKQVSHASLNLLSGIYSTHLSIKYKLTLRDLQPSALTTVFSNSRCHFRKRIIVGIPAAHILRSICDILRYLLPELIRNKGENHVNACGNS